MTGIICINKDEGVTSFSVVSKVRSITKEKKAGHTGTLDPMARGVLPIMLGGATRFLDYLPDSDKRYTASFILGFTTDTLDITGSVTAKYDVTATADDVRKALDNFRGRITQVPPMYSAVSVNGKRLYDLARQGIEVERPSRTVEIKKLDLLNAQNNEYEIDVLCSKGTYIRTLIDDIGKTLGCGAVMTKLTRTAAMGFSVDDSVTVDELCRIYEKTGSFDSVLTDIEKMFDSYESVIVSRAQAKRFSNGGALSLNRLRAKLSDGIYRVRSENGLFLGLGEADTQLGELKVKRLLTRRD